MLELKIKECEFEEHWTDEDGDENYYFIYPENYFETFRMLGYFDDREFYEEKYGPVISVCLRVTEFTNGARTLAASPTCAIEFDYEEDVEWHELDWTDVAEETIESLICVARKREMASRLKRLAKMADNLEEYAAALKTSIIILKADIEKEIEDEEE